MYHIENIAGVAPQPIQAGNDQFIARPQELDNGFGLCPARPRGAGDLFGAYKLAAFGSELFDLNIGILVDCAEAGVPMRAMCHLKIITW